MKYYLYGIYDKQVKHFRNPVLTTSDLPTFQRNIRDLIAYGQFEYPEACTLYKIAEFDDECKPEVFELIGDCGVTTHGRDGKENGSDGKAA